jgi:hypothetical protein
MATASNLNLKNIRENWRKDPDLLTINRKEAIPLLG